MADYSIIPSNKIDTAKWDACVAANTNGLIYACSFYLNAMAHDWYGLVINNYETIFPIPVKKKLGIQYMYMPPFTQQLGFIGNINLIDKKAIGTIQSFVKYGSPYLNFSNQNFAENQTCVAHNNFTIDLQQSHSSIKNNYKKTIDYSLSKAEKFNLQFTIDNNIDESVLLYQQYNKNNMQHVNNADYTHLILLLKQLQLNKQLHIRKAINANNELMSIALLMKDNKRYYNIINVTPEAGRKCEANYFLYNNILQELSEQPMLFDFEGSDLPGVQKFYEKFGATNQPYFHWHYNLLPIPIRWLKK
jgi:hypothetical protein